VAADVRAGIVDPNMIPVKVIVRDGNTLILSTRTAVMLTKAGVPRSRWLVHDVTGVPYFEEGLTRRLQKNNLTSQGIAYESMVEVDGIDRPDYDPWDNEIE
jgi:hypothetical protein